jgi:molybdopterin-containing oxidoreductase family iron-sulfur binding subunit
MSTKKYWKSLEDLNDSPELIKKASQEFAEPIPMEDFLSESGNNNGQHPRRDFLKFLGFSVTAATLAACETPVRKVVPYVVKPEEITVGVSNWYASAFYDGHDYCEVLVKTREGRPIKVEGNKRSRITQGATNARTQASVLSLYDEARFRGPVKGKESVSWDAADKEVESRLKAAAASGLGIRLLSSSIASPSTRSILAKMAEQYPTFKLVQHDAVSYSAIAEANQQSFGKAVVPSYDFSAARVMVGVGADFLGTWLSPIEFAVQYGKARKVEKGSTRMARHYQVESNLSITGSNADYRSAVKPSEQGYALLNLYNAVARLAGAASVASKPTSADAMLQNAAKDLWAAKGNALVVCGNNDVNQQVVTNAINALLNSYGTTINLDAPNATKQGRDADVVELINDMKSGKVGVLLVHQSNPVYSLPAALGFEAAMKKVPFTVNFSDRPDETTAVSILVCPDHHYLESWGDVSPRPGHYALVQPTIFPLHKTRAMQESLLKWTGSSDTYQDYVKRYWQENLFSSLGGDGLYDNWWMTSLHDGVRVAATLPTASAATANADLGTASAGIARQAAALAGAFEVTFYEKVGTGNGMQANNPWLQELPDPVSKVVWDNYITMSPSDMKKLQFTTEREQEVESDVAEVTINGVAYKLPVYAQPGQAAGTIGIALGYGRKVGGKVIETPGILGGANAFAAAGVVNNTLAFQAKADIKKNGETYMLASTQTHHTLMGRNMVKETTLAAYAKNAESGNEKETFKVKEDGEHVEKTAAQLDLWASAKEPGFDRPGHFWNISIDLSACIGCGNCITACQAENNVPVVGKDEVRKSRDMHWIRIDRYYSSDTKSSDKDKNGTIGNYRKMEEPSEQPEVLFQPVMCMHCNHAPCETVCPVLATTHSSEGLNQMTYNRCVGTKYCANNCPYKVRRFNWFRYNNNEQFNFNQNSELEKMVLNPDVTVRSRGVMEKCSMCVQRIQEGKLLAKRETRPLRDGEVNVACASSCPTNAIVFGDVNNKESQVSKKVQDERTYYMLEELDTKPSVSYMVKVRNKTGQSAEA